MESGNSGGTVIDVEYTSVDNANCKELYIGELKTEGEETEKVDIDKVDINILYYLITENKINPMDSSKIGFILEFFQKDLPVSYYTIVRRIQKLVKKGYVAEGYKDSNAKTYYILPKGINFMNENIFTEESIYEEENSDEESGE